MQGNVRIFAVFAIIIANLAIITPAAQAEDDFVILYDFSQTHCQLLQAASLKPAPTFGKRIEELTKTPDEFHLETQYENAPDFGFLLPKSWPTMSWAQRTRFNHAITALIKRRLNLPQQKALKEDCLPQIRIIEHPDQELELVEKDNLPRPPRLQAIVLMNMRGPDNSKTPLTYLFEKRWNIGWKTEDILLHTSSVKERDSQNLEEIIHTQGLNELEGYLKQLLDKE